MAVPCINDVVSKPCHHAIQNGLSEQMRRLGAAAYPEHVVSKAGEKPCAK